MSIHFGGRTLARSQAFQLLFQAEANHLTVEEVLGKDYVIEKGPLDEFARQLALGADAARHDLDAVIASRSVTWTLRRMPSMDRNLLRLAIYEMLFVDEVPVSVAINEAVELAKDFGGEDESPRFVNGVLGRIARQLEEDAKDPEAARRREEEALAANAFPTSEEDSAAEFAGEQSAAEGAVENAPAAEGEDTSADAVSPEEPACAAEEPTCAPEEPVNVGL